jgi:tetratricopeptide (TPR) repeat protein
LATIYANDGRYPKAAAAYIRSLQLAEARVGPSHPSTAMTVNNLGFLYLRMRRYQEAQGQFQHSLEILEKNSLMANEVVVRALHGLGQTSMARGENARAEPLLARAVEIGRTTKVRDSEMADLLDLYSTLLTNLSKAAEAEQLRTEAARLRAEVALTIRAGK